VLLLLAARTSEAIASASLQAAAGTAPSTPSAVPPWREAPGDAGGWQPRFHGYSNLATASYVSDGGREVAVFVAHYPGSAASGRELINSENRLHDPDTEKTSRPLERRVDVGGGAVPVIEMTVSGKSTANATRLTWTWYEVEGAMTASAIKLKVLALVALGRAEPAVQRVVVLHTSIADGDLDAGRRRLADFLQHQLSGFRMFESTSFIRQASRDAETRP
jgi:EpsI family protein